MNVTLSGSGSHAAVIDDDDFSIVAGFKWRYLRTKGGKEYAMTAIRDGNGRKHTVYMHRVLMGAEAGFEVDHINGDGLDNRRGNLRLATRQENCRNRRRVRNTPDGFKGIYFVRSQRTNPWRAVIWVNRKRIHLGMFPSAESAAKAYDDAAQRFFGSFAHLNFPAGGED